MQSPISAQGRVEDVVAFAARRAVANEWIADVRKPVPRFVGLDAYRAPNPLFAAIVELIDGQRSTAAIAEAIVQRLGIPERGAIEGVRVSLQHVEHACRSGRAAR